MLPLPSPVRARPAARGALALAVLAVSCALPARARSPGPDAAAPLRVLLIGDSHVVSGLGPPLEQLLGEGRAVSVVRRGKTSSGLARPDFFDWWAEARRLVDAHRPDVVVLLMGGNDGQDLISQTPPRRVRWNTAGWPEAYRQRVRSLLATLEAPGRRLVWLGLPLVDSPHLERKVERIRQLQREVIASVPSARYLETHVLLRGARGAPLRTVPGQPAAIRHRDGVHLTVAGGQYLAQQLAPLLRAHLPGASASARLDPSSGLRRPDRRPRPAVRLRRPTPAALCVAP